MLVIVLAVTVLLAHQGRALPHPGSYLANAPRHVPRIGRRSEGEQIVIPATVAKSLYYQMPRHYPRVGRRDPSVPLYPTRQRTEVNAGNNEDEELLALWRRASKLDESGDQYARTSRGEEDLSISQQYGEMQSNGQEDPGDTENNFKSFDVADIGQVPDVNYQSADANDARFLRDSRYDSSSFFRSSRDQTTQQHKNNYPLQNPQQTAYDDDNYGGGIDSTRDVAFESRGSFGGNQDHRPREYQTCAGLHCSESPSSAILEFMTKLLLKEIIARREKATNSIRLANNPPKRNWDPRHFWKL